MTLTASPRIDTRTALVQLLDTYGPMLTARQVEALRLHLEEDWSVTELAQGFSISRASAHELIRRGIGKIEQFERMLGMCRRLAEAERRSQSLEQQVAVLQDRLRRLEGGSSV